MTKRILNRSGVGLLAAVAAGLASTPARAADADVQAELSALRERIAQLEGRTRQAAAADAARAERAVADVLADADRRSRFAAAGGAVAGYDKGFFIGSEDGSFLLKPSAIFQFRGVSNTNNDGPDGTSDNQLGFEIRRARFRFDGNIISKDLTYSFVWDTNRQGGGVSLLDAWAAYRVAPEWSVKVGQFKESWTHEKDISFTGQLAVDRSLVDTLIGGNVTDRVQGVAAIYGGTAKNPVRAEVSFHDGANSKNTDFRDEIPAGTGDVLNPANFGVGARAEYKLFGDWASYRDFTAKGTKEDLLVVGAGLDYTQRGDGDTYLYTVDAQYETASGWNAYAAFIGNYVEGGGTDRNDFGILVQGGYLLAPAWEVFARYDVVLLDGDAVAGEDTFHEITAGVNYFLGTDGSALHRAKVTADVTYLPNGSPSAQTGIGVLAGDDSQFVFRAQFQLQL